MNVKLIFYTSHAAKIYQKSLLKILLLFIGFVSLTDILFINCALQEFSSIIVLCFCFLLSFHSVVVYVFLVRRNLSIPYYLLSCLFTFLHLFFLFLLIFAASCLLTSVVSPRYPLNVPQRNWSDFSTNFLPDLIGWLLNIFAWE